MHAVLLKVTQSNEVLLNILQTKDDQLMNTMTKLDDRSAELIEVTNLMNDERTQVMKMEILMPQQVEEISSLNLLLCTLDLYLQPWQISMRPKGASATLTCPKSVL